MLEPGTLVSAFSSGEAAARSHVKHARAGKEDVAPTATSIWASVALVRLQVCTRDGMEDAVPVDIEQKDQRRSGYLVYWVRREALGLKRGNRQQYCCCKRSAIQDRIFQHSPQSLQTRRQLRSKHRGDWQTPCKKRQVHISRAQLHLNFTPVGRNYMHDRVQNITAMQSGREFAAVQWTSATATATVTATQQLRQGQRQHDVHRYESRRVRNADGWQARTQKTWHIQHECF